MKINKLYSSFFFLELYGNFIFIKRINTYRTNNPNKQSEVFNYEREFISEVLQMAIGYWALDQTQCKQFDCWITNALTNYKELEERCTDIIDIEKSYLQYLQLFIIRKKQKENLTGHCNIICI